jgi:alpha-mannosidase
MHDNTALVEARIDRFVRDRITPAVYRRAVPLTITAWEAPGEPVPFAEAVSQTYEPFAVGSPWSRPWGTTWFHVTGTVPDDAGADGTSLEVLVDLGFSDRQPGFQAEGLVHRPDGSRQEATVRLRIDTPIEVDYYQHGGILPYVLRDLMKAA